MDQHPIFLLLGLANGAVFAALALALVVTYRSWGHQLRHRRDRAVHRVRLRVPAPGRAALLIPGLPRSMDLGSGSASAGAVVIALLVAALLGLLLYVSMFRPLRTAPPVAKAVASLGVMVVITGLIIQRLGTTRSPSPPIFADEHLDASATSGCRPTGSASRSTVVALRSLVVAALPVHAASVSPRARGRDREGRLRLRHLARPDRGGELDDQRRRRRRRRDPHRADLPLVPFSYTLFIVPALAAAILGGFQYIGPPSSAASRSGCCSRR